MFKIVDKPIKKSPKKRKKTIICRPVLFISDSSESEEEIIDDIIKLN